MECKLCGRPITKKRHGVIYCDHLCTRDAINLRHSIRCHSGDILRVIELLQERGDTGARVTGQAVDKVISWQWVKQENDGYLVLTEHGRKAITEFLGKAS